LASRGSRRGAKLSVRNIILRSEYGAVEPYSEKLPAVTPGRLTDKEDQISRLSASISRGDEVRTIAHNVLHIECAIKIATLGHSYPIVRRFQADLGEKHGPRGDVKAGKKKREPRRLTSVPQSEKDVMLHCI
jgi:hypothetical protein